MNMLEQATESCQRKTELEEEIKKVWYWNKDIHIGQWTITENPEINPHINCQLISIKMSRPYNREIIQFSKNGARKSEYPHAKY